MCCHRLKTTSMHTPRPLLFREYVLILSSAGKLSCCMIEILASLTGHTLSKTTILSRAFGMLETFLQTYLLINSSRRSPRDSHRVSPFIPYSSILLVIFYLTYSYIDSLREWVLIPCIKYTNLMVDAQTCYRGNRFLSCWIINVSPIYIHLQYAFAIYNMLNFINCNEWSAILFQFYHLLFHSNISIVLRVVRIISATQCLLYLFT